MDTSAPFKTFGSGSTQKKWFTTFLVDDEAGGGGGEDDGLTIADTPESMLFYVSAAESQGMPCLPRSAACRCLVARTL